MPLDPQNRAQILDRELRVWDLLLKGREGVEIARARRTMRTTDQGHDHPAPRQTHHHQASRE